MELYVQSRIPSQYREARPAWRDLGRRAKAFRLAHAAWGALNLAALAYIWRAAALRLRGRPLNASVALLLAEGGALVVGRGNCPFGPFQRSLGDPVPMFELVLPPRAAKAAIPILAVVSIASFAALLLRPPKVDASRHRTGARSPNRGMQT